MSDDAADLKKLRAEFLENGLHEPTLHAAIAVMDILTGETSRQVGETVTERSPQEMVLVQAGVRGAIFMTKKLFTKSRAELIDLLEAIERHESKSERSDPES